PRCATLARTARRYTAAVGALRRGSGPALPAAAARMDTGADGCLAGGRLAGQRARVAQVWGTPDPGPGAHASGGQRSGGGDDSGSRQRTAIAAAASRRLRT